MTADPSWQTQTLGDSSTWVLHPELLPFLQSEASLPIDRWLATGQAVVVKQGPHRAVWRVELPGLSFHLKRNHVPNWRAKLRGWLRGPKAKREFDLIRRVAERGIPTSEPLGWGRMPGRAGESFLITRTLAGVQPLHLYFLQTFNALDREEQTQVRMTLARELGDFIARMHRVGVDHRDLHAGNILVRFENGKPRLFLIDLDAVKLTKPLEGERRLQSLAMLNAWFRMHTERTDRLRFWKAYAARADFLPWKRFGHDAISLADDLEERSADYSLALWRSREARCLGNNRYYEQIERDDVRGHAVRGFESGQPLETIEVVRGRNAKAAMNAWKLAQAFRERGLPTPATLAVLLRRDGADLLMKRSVGAKTASEWIALRSSDSEASQERQRLEADGVLGLQSFATERRANGLPPGADAPGSPSRRYWIRRLADAYRDLHDRGIIWLAPRLESIALSDEDDWRYPEPPSLFPRVRTGLWFVDLSEMGLLATITETTRQVDLARLASSIPASRTDRLRFLRRYARPGLRMTEGWKAWWRQIAESV